MSYHGPARVANVTGASGAAVSVPGNINVIAVSVFDTTSSSSWQLFDNASAASGTSLGRFSAATGVTGFYYFGEDGVHAVNGIYAAGFTAGNLNTSFVTIYYKRN